MAEFYVAQIIQGGWNFAPVDTALCNGQVMAITQNQALFALLGTTFGGNGMTTFQLPDLQGRRMVHWGQGSGLSNYNIGQQAGVENVSILTTNLPAHTHTFNGSTSTFSASGGQPRASTQIPAAGSVLGHSVDVAPNPTSAPAIYCPTGTATPVALGGLNVAGTIGATGSNIPLPILNPYLAITCVIVLFGIFPSRN